MNYISRYMSILLLTVSIIAQNAPVSNAYTPNIHELYMAKGAEICEQIYGVAIEKKYLDGMIEGVREPDRKGRQTLQMLKQRFEPGSYGKQRDISGERIAAQALHGSPNPTRPVYTQSASDQAKMKQTIQLPADDLLPDRFPLDVYSYDTNQAVRNKILISASQFLCVSLAHKNYRQSARKFGNMMHMIGDTYSASHVQRSAPRGSLSNCGTEKIEWHFSMDLIVWKLHTPADRESLDWRFRCIVKHTADLMNLWISGREAVQKEGNRSGKLSAANEHIRRNMILLCGNILREDADVLKRPAGGAAAGYSVTSGADNWALFRKRKPDMAIQSVGLTGVEEAEAFRKTVNDRLGKRGSEIRFWYPPRNMKDLCRRILNAGPLPEPLKCTPQEIDWAMQGSAKVRTMWIPERTQP